MAVPMYWGPQSPWAAIRTGESGLIFWATNWYSTNNSPGMGSTYTDPMCRQLRSIVRRTGQIEDCRAVNGRLQLLPCAAPNAVRNDGFASRGIEPLHAHLAGRCRQVHGHVPTPRQIHQVLLARVGQTITARG